ncbi:MAG TPA: tetratricopeptide repeat protein, partial [Nannocystaceae bacterium]|nr:tetratricopeptide repeat protein [Nannocystaceae bacterium]
ARELEVLDELAGALDDPQAPSAAEIAIVQRALAGRPRAAVPTKRRWPWAVAGTAIAAAAIAAVALSSRDRGSSESIAPPVGVAQARLVLAAGEVTIDGRPIADTLPTIANDTTLAVRDGRACVTIDLGVDVCLDASTTATVQGLGDPQLAVEVRRGHAVARLDPLPEGRSFALSGASVRAVAVGTMFSLDVSHDGATVTAAVLHGVVEIGTDDATVRLAANELVRIADGSFTRARLTSADEARDLALVSALPPSGVAIGHVAIEVSPVGASVTIDERELGTSPLFAALPAGLHRLELRGADGAQLGETLDVRAGSVLSRRFALAAIESPAPLAADDEIDIEIADEPDAPATDRKRVPESSPRELLAEARTLRREDRWADAVAAYRTLIKAHPRSSEAHTALVSLGDLLLDRLGQPDQAARAYQRYVKEGGGVLAAEARWGIISARRKQGDRKAEKDAIAEFLRHHGDDARAESLR